MTETATRAKARHRPLHRIPVVWSSALAFAAVVVLSSTMAGANAPARAVLPRESPTCALVETNGTLAGDYNSLYSQLATDPGHGGAGPNQTPALPQSGYPNESVGDRQLISAWSTICDSPAYTTLYDRWGATAVTSGSQLNGSTGDYQFDYGFIWHASCEDPTVIGTPDCEYTATWWVDLVTGGIDGPLSAKMTDCGPCGAPRAPPIGFASMANTTGLQQVVYLAPIVYVDPGTELHDVGFEVATFGCSPVPAVESIEIVTAGGAVVGWEQNASAWAEGANIAPAVGDQLVITASQPLPSTEWVMAYNVSGSSGSTATRIAGSGPWDGCGFTPGFQTYSYAGSFPDQPASSGAEGALVGAADAGLALGAVVGVAWPARHRRGGPP